ncbi:MAG: site-specific integrase, partial [Desulfobulbaceae bacterium]|nr:site-specific integrase [Desulfobulbaceae bacterium]
MFPHLDGYLHYLYAQKRLARNTLDAYRFDILFFFDFLKSQHVESIKQVGAETVRAFFTYCHGCDISSRSNARRLAALKSFFDYLFRQKIISDNPLARMQFPKIGRGLP